MDNFFEVLALEDFNRDGKSKLEGLALKQEKFNTDLPAFGSGLQSGLKRVSPDSSKVLIEKHRHRGFVQNRPEQFAFDLKPQKRIFDKELEKISMSRVPFLPLLSIRTNAIEELYKEVKELKQGISEIEEKNKVNSHCIQTGKMKIQELEDRYSLLKKKTGVGYSVEERKEELQGKLKKIHKEWVKNSIMLKAKILELEEETKKLDCQSDSLKNQIFRRSNQQKILKKNLNDSGSISEDGHRSCDRLSSSGKIQSVTHTPSWNSLCIN